MWKLRDFDLSKVSVYGNGAVNVLDQLNSDGVSLVFDGAVVEHVIACSWCVKGEAGDPPPGAAHDKGRVAASVLDGSTDEGSGVGDWCAKVDESKATREVNETRRNCD